MMTVKSYLKSIEYLRHKEGKNHRGKRYRLSKTKIDRLVEEAKKEVFDDLDKLGKIIAIGDKHIDFNDYLDVKKRHTSFKENK